jgi:hypothetical protein
MEVEEKHQQENSSAEVPKAASPKTASPKVETAKADAPMADFKITAIVAAKKFKADDLVMSTPMTDGDLGSPNTEAKNLKSEGHDSHIYDTDHHPDPTIVNAKKLELESHETNTKHASQTFEVSIAEAQHNIEQPATIFPKPGITETDGHKLAVREDKSYVKKTSVPMASLKSQTGEVLAEAEVESKPKKKASKKKRKSTTKSDAGQSTASLNSKDSSETLKSSFMTESTEYFITARSSPNPSLASRPSDTCLCADDTTKFNPDIEASVSSPLENKHQEVVKHSKADSNASAGSTPKSTLKSGKRSYQNHSKTDSNSSTMSTGSVCKADQKSNKSGEKTGENAKPAEKNLNGAQNENRSSSPAVNLDDSTQWPILGPTKAPLMVDCKPPAVPTLQPLGERKKNTSVPIVPAVPLNMLRRRPS